MASNGNILIKKSDSISDFERYLCDLNQVDRQITLPSTISAGGSLGVGGALIQFLLTWSRHSKSRILKTFLNSNEDEELSDFVSRNYGLAAAYFADRVISDRSSAIDLRDFTLRAARGRIRAMFDGRIEETAKGREIEFAFVQGATREFHGSFYSRAPDEAEKRCPRKHGELIRKSGELDRFCDRCMEFLGVKLVPQELFGLEFPFGTLFEEILRNTAEHAYLSETGEFYDRNFRSVRIANVFVERHLMAAQTVSSSESRQVAECYFLSHGEASDSATRTVNFLEITIQDSGPGFAATTPKDSTTEGLGERELVARCFESYQSSKNFNVSGQGLQRILRVVDQLNGFLRVRTGGTEAFYAPVKGLDLEVNPINFVHDKLSEDVFLPRVEGTLVTVGIPIPR